jgi:hypothetical protein
MTGYVAIGLAVAILIGSLNAAIPAVGADTAPGGAEVRPVGIGQVAVAVVALLGSVDHPVATIVGQGAIGVAGAVAAVVHAVVAFLARIANPVAALELTAKIAKAGRGAILRTVVTLLAGIHGTVAAVY